LSKVELTTDPLFLDYNVGARRLTNNETANTVIGILCDLGMLLAACAPINPAAPSPLAESIYAPIVSGAPLQERGLRIGVVVFLSSGAAEPFGIPARNGAQVMIEALNSGQAPAPYDTPGIGGVPIAAVYVDEAGGAEQQAAELRRLFEVEQVDLVIGYISSGDCLAVAPVAEELQKLTIAFDCGTSRLFEERDYRYVFRTNAHQAIDSLGGARYLLQYMPDLQTVAGINQNYSWGQDSWAHFRDTLAQLQPGVRVVGEQFPKLFADDFTAEIAAASSWAAGNPYQLLGADLRNLSSRRRQPGYLTPARC
jgi:branched-chain amino acid transport system substrate-binding protein